MALAFIGHMLGGKKFWNHISLFEWERTKDKEENANARRMGSLEDDILPGLLEALKHVSAITELQEVL